MPKQKVMRTKGLIVSAVAVTGLVTGGYALSSTGALGAQEASATKGGGYGQQGGWNNNEAEDAAMVVSAVQMYQTEQQVAPGAYKVTNLEVSGEYARGKVLTKPAVDATTPATPAPTSNVFYAVKENNEWKVIYAGTTTPPAETSDQLKLPAQWKGQTDWKE